MFSFQVVLVLTISVAAFSNPVDESKVKEIKKVPIVSQEKVDETKSVVDDSKVQGVNKDQPVGVKTIVGADVVGKEDGVQQGPVQLAGEVPEDAAAAQDASPVEKSGTADLETANTFWGG